MSKIMKRHIAVTLIRRIMRSFRYFSEVNRNLKCLEDTIFHLSLCANELFNRHKVVTKVTAIFIEFHCLGPFGLLLQNLILTVETEKSKLQCQQHQCLVRACFLVHRQLFSHCVLTWQKLCELSDGHIPITRALSSRLPKGSTSNQIASHRRLDFIV